MAIDIFGQLVPINSFVILFKNQIQIPMFYDRNSVLWQISKNTFVKRYLYNTNDRFCTVTIESLRTLFSKKLEDNWFISTPKIANRAQQDAIQTIRESMGRHFYNQFIVNTASTTNELTTEISRPFNVRSIQYIAADGNVVDLLIKDNKTTLSTPKTEIDLDFE
jgi:hypothetical protein